MVRTALAAFAALTVLSFTLTFTTTAGAQELPKAKKLENTAWFGVLSLKFKPDKFQEGRSIVFDHLAPAGTAAGMSDVRVLEPMGGEWDMLIFFPMKNGAADLEWEVSPDDERFFAELAKREGGAAQAMEVFGRYLGSLERSNYQIMLERRGQDDTPTSTQ